MHKLLFAVYCFLIANEHIKGDLPFMSDKDRNKKDGENKEKKNNRMREAVGARE